jgi:hypothetical protein
MFLLRFFSGMMLFPQMTHATVIGENFLSILQRLRMNHLRKIKISKKKENKNSNVFSHHFFCNLNMIKIFILLIEKKNKI